MGSKTEVLQNISDAIRNNINEAAHSFVSTGYYLKQVRNDNLFLELGYKDVWEYASVEFGISKSNACRFMKINDKFSIEGNSTTLLEQYNNFSYSKLQEMLTLDEEQLNNITDDMTVKQIREIKKPDVEVNDNQHDDVDEEDENELEMNMTVHFDDEDIPQEYDENIKVNIAINEYREDEVEDIDNDAPGATSQQENEINTMDCEIEHVIGEVVIETTEQENNDVIINVPDNVRSRCLHDEVVDCNIHNAKDIALSIGADCKSICCMSCEESCGARCNYSAHNNKVENDVIEIKEMVIKEPKKPLYTAKQHIEDAIKKEEEILEQMESSWKKNQPDTLLKHKTLLLAYKCLLTDMDNPRTKPINQEQPELQILRNNEQRKEFIDNFFDWKIWIDQQQTSERYYRYDFDNGVSFVIRVSMIHAWESGKYSKISSWGNAEYFIIGVDDKYYKGVIKTFKESSSNKSAMIDYLKDYQKKE